MFKSQTHNKPFFFFFFGQFSYLKNASFSFFSWKKSHHTVHVISNDALNFHSGMSNALSVSSFVCLQPVWREKWLCAYACFSMPRRKSVQHKLSAHMHTRTLCVHSEKWSCPHLYNLMKFVNRKANGCFDESSALMIKGLFAYMLRTDDFFF